MKVYDFCILMTHKFISVRCTNPGDSRLHMQTYFNSLLCSHLQTHADIHTEHRPVDREIKVTGRQKEEGVRD